MGQQKTNYVTKDDLVYLSEKGSVETAHSEVKCVLHQFMACLLLRKLKRMRINILPLFHFTFAGSEIGYSLMIELSKLDYLVPNYIPRGRTSRSTDHSIAQYSSLSKWHETIGATINRIQTKQTPNKMHGFQEMFSKPT
jgi:hypothetical protein